MAGASFILRASADQYEWAGAGQLSIKSFSGGAAFYAVGRARYLVDDQSFLVLNQDQPYAITIEAAEPVDSFCVFFAPDLAADAWRNLESGPERLLADPAGSAAPEPLRLFQRTYAHDTIISPALRDLRRALESAPREPAWIEERLHDLAIRLFQVNAGAVRDAERLPQLRAATRQELYRRLHLARDYAAALYDQPLTLGDLAGVAGLSPNHLLRTFKQAFRQTPYQYLTLRRLEQARRLLRASDLSITEICFAVGFESLGAFSALFRRRVGLSPSQYRGQNGDFEEAQL